MFVKILICLSPFPICWLITLESRVNIQKNVENPVFLQEKYLQMVGFSTSMLVYRRVPSGWRKKKRTKNGIYSWENMRPQKGILQLEMFDDRRVTPWWISHNLHWNHGFMVSNEYWIHEKRGPSLGVRSKATEVRHFWKTCVKAVDPRNGMGSKSRSSNIWAGDSWVLSKSPIQWSLSHIISHHII
jgi:hypothetical protein